MNNHIPGFGIPLPVPAIMEAKLESCASLLTRSNKVAALVKATKRKNKDEKSRENMTS
jgi:hypothetical protein